MSQLDQRFEDLCQRMRQISYLESTAALLEWDQQTKLPEQASRFRSQQVTYLAGLIHEQRTDPSLGELISDLAGSELMSQPQSDVAVTIRELKRDYDKKVKLPAKLVQEIALAASEGQTIWVKARKDDDFAAFAPQLKKIFQLKKEEAEALGYEQDVYDALLDQYEPGAKTKEVTQVLEALRQQLVPLVNEISESSFRPDAGILRRHYPIQQQETFATQASAKIGFEYDRGRLDVTHHPFCTEIGPDDCRITTRYDENFFNSAFFGTLHEAGHGIYEQGLQGQQYGLPLGQYCSLGVHESQSRLWENLVGRSKSFWSYFYPQAQACFPEALGDVAAEEFYRAVNDVAPSLIRVEADEVTYNLHIIIRFELEQAVLRGDLPTEGLPSAWKEKYRNYLGIEPPNDSDGVLQDVHWSCGLIGYFPTYSLGNLIASQLFEAATSELGDLSPQFEAGEFAPLKSWLNRKIHSEGRRYSSTELVSLVTEQVLSPESLVKSLRTKLAPIYDL